MAGEVEYMHDAFPYRRVAVALPDGHGLREARLAMVHTLDGLF